jgi:hypothetical protein
MSTLIRLLDLVTSDTLTMTAAGVLAVAVIGLVLVISWPANDAKYPATSRPATARSLAASGLPLTDIARRTGLSRDALVLLSASATRMTRQKQPGTERSSGIRRLFRRAGTTVHGAQVAT